MKKLLSLVLACALLVAVFAGCSGGASSSAVEDPSSGAEGDKVITIGVFEPASGDNAAGGKQETLGVKYANEVCPTV